MSIDLLYLDFDGVLHPGPNSSLMADKNSSLKYEANLFRSADLLANYLRPYPADVRIVLSTSWVMSYGLERTRELLPDELARRVIGATFDERTMDRYQFCELPRHDQILRDVAKRKASRWLAIDDDRVGWPPSQLGQLVAPPVEFGLQCQETQVQLQRALATIFRATDNTRGQCAER